MRTYSHSAIKTFQRCARKWAFLYIDRIVPEFRSPAMEKGIRLHDILAAYYGSDNYEADFTLTEEEQDLMYRYDLQWFDEDDEWKILHVEEEFLFYVGNFKVVFKPDLVVKINDEVWIVDHKTTANIPEEYDPYNMTDFQHLLYVAGLQALGYNVAGFIFNYIRTKPPSQPKLIKDGSRIADVRRVDTDYKTLERFATLHDVMDEDTMERLSMLKHAPNKFFQRHFLPVNQKAVDTAVRDVTDVLGTMALAEEEVLFPRHVLAGYGGSVSCARCEYQPICHAELVGIDADPDTFGYIEKPRRELP